MPTYSITDDACCLLLSVDGVSRVNLPKDETVLQLVLAGEYSNESGVDQVWLVYEGKHTWELPYDDITVAGDTPVSAEDLRTKILAILNTGACVDTPVEWLPNVGFGAPIADGGVEIPQGAFDWFYVNGSQIGGSGIYYQNTRAEFICPGANDGGGADAVLGIPLTDGDPFTPTNYDIDTSVTQTLKFEFRPIDIRSGSEVWVTLFNASANQSWTKSYKNTVYGSITETILPGDWVGGSISPQAYGETCIRFLAYITDSTGSELDDSFYIDDVSLIHTECL